MLGVAATNITILDYDGMYSMFYAVCPQFLTTDVSVSIPAIMMATEGDEEVKVCATLSAKQNIERSVTITIATSIINAE